MLRRLWHQWFGHPSDICCVVFIIGPGDTVQPIIGMDAAAVSEPIAINAIVSRAGRSNDCT